MKFQSALLALGLIVAAAACSSSTSPSNPPTAAVNTGPGKFRTVYTFKDEPDGKNPLGDLIEYGGKLYGTTYWGGHYNEGAVFTVTPAGVEKVIYPFKGVPVDGAHPRSGLSVMGGKLYGTTYYGGSFNQGSVYVIDPAGNGHILFHFKGATGSHPIATVIPLNGILYGTTYYGGKHNAGTVFSIDRDGNQEVLVDFDGGNGKHPYAPLLALNGALYGTTLHGGMHGYGTVFRLDPTTNEFDTIYNFECTHPTNCAYWPKAGLRYDIPYLRGTTSWGGTYARGGACKCGTTFELRGGKIQTASFTGYSLDDGGNGNYPESGLTVLKSRYYGVAPSGGNGLGCAFTGCGTVYEAGPTTIKVIHFFQGSDGKQPTGAMAVLNGKLYGTTEFGGEHDHGTIFEVIP